MLLLAPTHVVLAGQVRERVHGHVQEVLCHGGHANEVSAQSLV